jgi:hypothetical protein
MRVFGPKEDEARRMVASVPGLHYMPAGASLEQAVREIVSRVNAIS